MNMSIIAIHILNTKAVYESDKNVFYIFSHTIPWFAQLLLGFSKGISTVECKESHVALKPNTATNYNKHEL